MSELTPSARASGTAALVVGAVAFVGYAVLGASPESPDLPFERLLAAALLVVAGGALRQGRGPSWGPVLVAALAGLIAVDLVARVVG